MCSGRVDLRFLLRAFANGSDGVFVGGCRLNDCNYVTHGNYDALAVTHICKKLLARIGLDPARLQIAFMSGGDGNILAERINEFSREIREKGPLGIAEGVAPELLATRLAAAERLAPFLRLVERERLRVPVKTASAYAEFFASAEIDALFDAVVGDRLATSQILLLLGERPLSTAEIAATLGLSPSEVSKHMNASSRHGLVRYDVEQKRYALAPGA
jgi:coenzyme F420-reducing hydrogenase delta subunit/biotin operon repressor